MAGILAFKEKDMMFSIFILRNTNLYFILFLVIQIITRLHSI